jgi:hypothetical protein
MSSSSNFLNRFCNVETEMTRNYDRYPPRDGVISVLEIEGIESKGILLDISSSGIYITNDPFGHGKEETSIAHIGSQGTLGGANRTHMHTRACH